MHLQNFEERQAAIAREREALDTKHKATIVEAKRVAASAEVAHRDAMEAHKQKEAALEEDARTKRNTELDKRFGPLISKIVDQPSNATLAAFAEAFREEEEKTQTALGPGAGVQRRLLFAFAEYHRKRAPGLVCKLSDEQFWRSSHGGSPLEQMSALSQAARRGNLAELRTRITGLDAHFWGLGGSTDPDPDAEKAWKARLDPDPRVFRKFLPVHEAKVAEKAKARADEATRVARERAHQAGILPQAGIERRAREGQAAARAREQALNPTSPVEQA